MKKKNKEKDVTEGRAPLKSVEPRGHEEKPIGGIQMYLREEEEQETESNR